MALTKQFSKKLNDLWRRRTSKVRDIVIPKKAGKPLLFSKKVRDKIIGELLERLTFLLLLKMADEQSRPPFNKPSAMPKEITWLTCTKT
jgi:hypothetical protein